MKKTMALVRRRLNKHTEKAMFDWCDHGCGSQNEKSIYQTQELIWWIEELLERAQNGEKLP